MYNNNILAVRSQKQRKNLLPWLMCCCCFFSFPECYNGIHGAHTLIVNVFVNIIPTTKNYSYSSKHVLMSPTVLNGTAQHSDKRLSQNKRLRKEKTRTDSNKNNEKMINLFRVLFFYFSLWYLITQFISMEFVLYNCFFLSYTVLWLLVAISHKPFIHRLPDDGGYMKLEIATNNYFPNGIFPSIRSYTLSLSLSPGFCKQRLSSKPG